MKLFKALVIVLFVAVNCGVIPLGCEIQAPPPGPLRCWQCTIGSPMHRDSIYIDTVCITEDHPGFFKDTAGNILESSCKLLK